MKQPFDPFSAATKLLASLGHSPSQAVTPMPGGRNNHVWRVQCTDRSFLLKHYFWSEQDPRDRLGQEWAFLEYLREIGCHQAPEPIISDPATRCVLMEFIEGRPLEISDVTENDILAATDFFIGMNSNRTKAMVLPPVSEACFSVADHLTTTAVRVQRLKLIQPESHAHRLVLEFTKKSIIPLWAAIDRRIRMEANIYSPLCLEERCVSPSDFGFHNALRQPDGAVRFIDFEYAGWDDPAKTIIDFCNQPDRILPDEFAVIFRERAISAHSNPEALTHRVRLLEALYQLKWACICLNNFLPGRGFHDPDPKRTPAAQFARSKVMAKRAAGVKQDFET